MCCNHIKSEPRTQTITLHSRPIPLFVTEYVKLTPHWQLADGGVVGPKELVGWVVTVTDSRSYTPPTRRFTEVEAQFFTTVSKHCDGQCKTFLLQDVSSKNHPCMVTCRQGKSEKMCFHFSKHVLSDIRCRKTCVLTSDFVLGVGGGRFPG